MYDQVFNAHEKSFSSSYDVVVCVQVIMYCAIPVHFKSVAVLRYSNRHVLTSLYCQCLCIHVHAFVSLCVNCFALFEALMEH